MYTYTSTYVNDIVDDIKQLFVADAMIYINGSNVNKPVVAIN